MVRRGAAAVLAALGLAACGGSDSGDGRPPDGPAARIGTPVRLVDCTDWRRSGVRARYDTVRALRRFAGGPSGSPAGRGSTLEDGDAYELFESYCANDFARDFKLYKLYTRAASFRDR